jgi:hypothetical protein
VDTLMLPASAADGEIVFRAVESGGNPSTWAALMIGFAGLGFAGRRAQICSAPVQCARL